MKVLLLQFSWVGSCDRSWDRGYTQTHATWRTIYKLDFLKKLEERKLMYRCDVLREYVYEVGCVRLEVFREMLLHMKIIH